MCQVAKIAPSASIVYHFWYFSTKNTIFGPIFNIFWVCLQIRWVLPSPHCGFFWQKLSVRILGYPPSPILNTDGFRKKFWTPSLIKSQTQTKEFRNVGHLFTIFTTVPCGALGSHRRAFKWHQFKSVLVPDHITFGQVWPMKFTSKKYKYCFVEASLVIFSSFHLHFSLLKINFEISLSNCFLDGGQFDTRTIWHSGQ